MMFLMMRVVWGVDVEAEVITVTQYECNIELLDEADAILLVLFREEEGRVDDHRRVMKRGKRSRRGRRNRRNRMRRG
jgi:hypothetical protein